MTHTTDQERAEVIYTDQGINVAKDGVLVVFIPWEQAARRAQVVQLDALSDARDVAMQWCIKGRVPECGAFAQIAQGLDAMLAAAPQPPEANSAEFDRIEAAEHEALRSVYEAARGLLRYEGVDDGRAIAYREKLASAIEEVKHIDGGLWEPQDSLMSDFRTSKTVAAPVQMPEPVAFALEWTFNGEERGMRLYDDETHCRFDAESDGGVCHPLYTEHQVSQLLAAKPTDKGE